MSLAKAGNSRGCQPERGALYAALAFNRLQKHRGGVPGPARPAACTPESRPGPGGAAARTFASPGVGVAVRLRIECHRYHDRTCPFCSHYSTIHWNTVLLVPWLELLGLPDWEHRLAVFSEAMEQYGPPNAPAAINLLALEGPSTQRAGRGKRRCNITRTRRGRNQYESWIAPGATNTHPRLACSCELQRDVCAAAGALGQSSSRALPYCSR